MISIVMKLIASLLLLAGTVLIYDARIITKTFFGFGDQNEGRSGLKIIGFIMLIIGGVVFYIVK